MVKRKRKNNTQTIQTPEKDENRGALPRHERGYYNRHPVFSFKDFCIEASSKTYYTKEDAKGDKRGLFTFLNGITKFSKHTWKEIKDKPHQFHFHAVDEDIPGLKQECERVNFQFKLPDFKEGRFIGYFNEDNVFCLLIYDSKHTVYPK